MPLTMDIGGVRAAFRDGVWTSTTPNSEAVLETLNAMMTEAPGPSGSDPYPALTRAREIATRLRGHIVDEGAAPISMSRGDD